MDTCPTPEIVSLQIIEVIRRKYKERDDAANHICHFQHCKIKNVPVEIHKLGGTFHIVCPFIKPVHGLDKQKTLHKKVYNIYYCPTYRKVHYCHADCCGKKILSDENVETCTISGQQYECEQVRTYGIASRVQTNTTADKSDPLQFSRDVEGRVMRTSGVHNTNEMKCKMIADETIRLFLFSHIRRQSEINKMNELERDARKLVGKYFRSMDKKKVHYNYIHIMTIYLNEIKKRPVRLTMLRKTPREIEEIVDNYTKELIGYWKMILYQTNLGRQSPNHFPFKTFVPSCLYIMKRGVKIKNQVVIRQSQFLSTCLPETNTLDVYNINKTPFTASKNHIMQAIRDTVQGDEEKAKCLYNFSVREAEKVL